MQWAYMLAGKEPGRWHFYIFGYSYLHLYRSCGKLNILHKINIWIIKQRLFQALLDVVVSTVVKTDFIILLSVVKGTFLILGNSTSLENAVQIRLKIANSFKEKLWLTLLTNS